MNKDFPPGFNENQIAIDFDGVILDSNQTKTQSFLELYKNEKKNHTDLILKFLHIHYCNLEYYHHNHMN